MIKKMLSILFVLLLTFGACALAEDSAPAQPEATQTAQPSAEGQLDLSAMSEEELLELRAQIDAALSAKGYNPYFDIERGAKSEAVSQLQERLQALGFYGGRITGKFDTETQKAFKQFEKANGLKNDGIASREDQMALFSDEVIGKVTPTPKLTPEPTPEPTEGPYSEYGELDYAACARNPERFIGEKVALKGRVMQVLGTRSKGFELRLATSGREDIVYVFVNFDPGYNILEDDQLLIYAQMRETITYETVLGSSITIPAAQAEQIILR